MKRTVYLKAFTLVASLGFATGTFAIAPVVDESENFALFDEQLAATETRSDAFVSNENDESNDALTAQADDTESFDAFHDNETTALAHDDSQPEQDPQAILNKVQTMQQELSELRGQLEVQTHALDTIKEQQQEFYKALDTKLQAGLDSVQTAEKLASDDVQAQNNIKPAEINNEPVTNAPRGNPADEQVSYLAAYDLVKSEEYDKAIFAMKGFVNHYPRGGYTANAYYWLGEVYLIKEAYPEAIQSFETVLNNFPGSSKSSAALLKLGYAYEASGEKQKARDRFTSVIRDYPDTHAASLAEKKLETL